MSKEAMPHFNVKNHWLVYVLQLCDDTLYTGITNDLVNRIKAHENGHGSKYVRSRLPFRVIYIELGDDRSQVSIREARIKKLPRRDKLCFTHGFWTTKQSDELNKWVVMCSECGLVLAVSKTYTNHKFTIDCFYCNKKIKYVNPDYEEEEVMEFKVKPLYDQVFVKKDDDEKTKSGLHLPQSVKGRAVLGTVVAAGPGMLSPYTGGYLPMTVKAGDRVYLREFTGYIIKHEGQEVHVFKENEIIGLVED